MRMGWVVEMSCKFVELHVINKRVAMHLLLFTVLRTI